MSTTEQAVTVGHEYGPSRVGHGEAQCIHCLGTNRENAIIAPNECSVRRSRLASVSSASAEGWKLVPVEMTDEMASAAAVELMAQSGGLGWEPTAIYRAMLAASPEPVPATNQAGEVEEALGHLEWLCGIAYNEGGAHELGYDPLKVVVAALATQPATSQEGEVDEFAGLEPHEHEDQRELSLLYNHRPDDSLQFNRGQMRMAIHHGRRLAATPTPPTLSEDLREAYIAGFEQGWEFPNEQSPTDEAASYAQGYLESMMSRAALARAQVKAS